MELTKQPEDGVQLCKASASLEGRSRFWSLTPVIFLYIYIFFYYSTFIAVGLGFTDSLLMGKCSHCRAPWSHRFLLQFNAGTINRGKNEQKFNEGAISNTMGVGV